MGGVGRGKRSEECSLKKCSCGAPHIHKLIMNGCVNHVYQMCNTKQVNTLSLRAIHVYIFVCFNHSLKVIEKNWELTKIFYMAFFSVLSQINSFVKNTPILVFPIV